MASIDGVTDQRLTALERWELACTDPGAVRDPADLARRALDWRRVRVPTTVASALGPNPGLDASDYWFRTRLAAPTGNWSLRFHGLATLADVWIDGVHAFASGNMFVARECDGGAHGRDVELLLRFASLDAFLRERSAARPRWRTRLVENELRRARTTLFGRLPGFAPLVPPIGPWRPIELVEHGALRVLSADVRTRAREAGGSVSVQAQVQSARPIRSAVLRVGDDRAELAITASSTDETLLSGALELPRVERWWPHTHGPQPLYPVSLWLALSDSSVEIDLGKTGFRTVELDREHGDFRLVVNDEPIFARGACWLPLDALALDAPDASLARALDLARGAGMNLLRVAAQGTYESNAFFRRCAELGLLVWQDFQFARLDYPLDTEFCRSVEAEALGFLDRSQLCPALAVLCGNSEVEQQVAMFGLDPQLAKNPLFYSLLPELCASSRPDVPYLPSTPSGGALPFHPDAGVAHYFGVGAYRRPLSDARLANVRFAAECLAFSNVPERALVDELLNGEAPGTSPRWKQGIPRDNGASWDFEDVRDHYLEQCFDLDARELRIVDPERWLELGRIASADVIAKTIAAFRRAGSSCSGALIWHLKDIVPGAGCGLLDARGRPKAAYWFAARAFRPIALFLNDEGLNGLRTRAINDTARGVAAELQVSFYRNGALLVDRVAQAIALPARSAVEISLEALLGRFIDSSYAYRFGPPNHDAIAARLIDRANGTLLADALHFPGALPSARRDLSFEATITPQQNGFALTLSASALAYAVHIEAPGFEPGDDYFHLEPETPRTITLHPSGDRLRATRIRVSALNAASAKTVPSA